MPVLGVLEVRDFGQFIERRRKQRYLRVAYLMTPDPVVNSRRQAMWPLFEPRMVSLEGDVMLLEGIAHHVEETAGPVLEFVQVWQCKILSGTVTRAMVSPQAPVP